MRYLFARFRDYLAKVLESANAPIVVIGKDRQITVVNRAFLAVTGFSREDFLWTSPVKHLLCWRRDFALAIGGMDESLLPVGPDDYDFPWCMAEAGATFKAVEECLYIYRDHREAFRLTTHLPLAVHTDGIRRILEKHGIDEATIATRLSSSEQSYLRQCLYQSWEDKVEKEATGYDPRDGWRDTYR